MKRAMSTKALFDIISEVQVIKLTKVAQIDRIIDWVPSVRAATQRRD